MNEIRLLLKSKTRLFFTNELLLESEIRLLLKSKIELLLVSELLLIKD